MPVAKQLSYIRSQSRADRPQQINGRSFAHFSIQHDQARRACAQRTSSEPPAVAAARVAPRSIVRSVAQFAGTAGETLFAAATLLLSEILNGWAAHALAMYGLPVAIEEPRDTAACKQSDPSRATATTGAARHLDSR